MDAWFEIVQTDAEQPFHARLIASNGEEVWRTSENYARSIDTRRAIEVLAATFGYEVISWDTAGLNLELATSPSTGAVSVLTVDERGQH